MIGSICIILLLYGLLPLLLGAGVTALFSMRGGRLSASYVSGYVLLFAAFYAVASISSGRKYPYTALLRYWPRVIIALGTAALILFILGIVRGDSSKSRLQPVVVERRGSLTRYQRTLVITTVCLVIAAVVLLVPGAGDLTPELTRMTLQTRDFISADPAAGTAYAAGGQTGMIYLLYAAGTSLSGVAPTTLIHLAMPICLIPLYICACIRIAWIFYPQPDDDRHRLRFIMLIVIFWLVMTMTDAHIGMRALNNSWNGVTLAASCLLPMFFAECVETVRFTLADRRHRAGHESYSPRRSGGHHSFDRLRRTGHEDPGAGEKTMRLIWLLLRALALGAAVALCVPAGWLLILLLCAAAGLTVLAVCIFDRRGGGAR